MSYNESMNSNSNYPLMSQSEWDSAPFNEVSVPEKTFDMVISQTLSKSVEVLTDDYVPEYDDEDRRTYANTEDTHWDQVYHENDYHTPLQLIELFKKYLESQLTTKVVIPKSPSYLKRLIKECEGWIEDETEYLED